MKSVQLAIIAHPYPLDRMALREIIKQQNPRIIIIEAISFSELLTQLDHHHTIDLLLLELDLALVQGNSLDQLTGLCTNNPVLKTVTISQHRNKISHQLLRRQGVAGNISSKDSRQTVIAALQNVAEGKNWFRSSVKDSAHSQTICELSQQEQRVMDALVKGLMNKQIADELNISPNTAKVHVRSILRKWKVKNRTQAVLVHRQQMINSKRQTTRRNLLGKREVSM